MKLLKLLIVIILVSVFSVAKGQDDDSLPWDTIAEYITRAQKSDTNPKNQMYNMILAADNVLSKSVTSYETYVAVYQYLISGFSELGANMVVDYLVRVPYLEYLNADDEQRSHILDIAESYNRVKIGSEAPEIQSITVFGKDFDLYDIDKKYTVVLFWSYSCPHCRNLLKELAGFASKHKDVAVVTVNVSGDSRQVKKLIKKSGLKKQYNIYEENGWDSAIVENYAVDMTPSLFLLDENKVIIAKPFDFDEVIEIVDL